MSKDIGKIISQGLRKKGFSQKDLAEKLGVHQSSITKWVSGRAYPAAQKLLDIIKILDLVEDFFPGYTKNASEKAVSKLEDLEERVSMLEKMKESKLFDSF